MLRRETELAYQDLAYDVLGDYVPTHSRPIVGHSPRIMTNVANEWCVSLVDTGSQVTCISADKFEKIDRKKIDILPVSNLTVVGAFGKRAKRISTQMQANMHIGGNKWKIRFLVIPELSYDVILGNDIMDKLKAVIDYGDKSIRFGEALIKGISISFNSNTPSVSGELGKVTVRSGLMVRNSNVEKNGNKALSIDSILISEPDPVENISVTAEVNFIGNDEIIQHIRETVKLGESDMKQLIDLVLEYRDVFSEDAGCLVGYEHELKLTVKRPVIRSSYSIPIAHRSGSLIALKKLLDAKVVEKSDSAQCNPIRAVEKRDGTIRLCLDARRLNTMIEGDQEGPPAIADITQKYHGTTHFFLSDMTCGYYHVLLAKESRQYTAFVIEGQCYQFTRVPMGLKTAGAIFMRAIRQVFGSEFEQFLTTYVDDLLINSRSFTEHLNNLRKLFEKCMEVGLRLNLKKTVFCGSEVPFLGFILSVDGLRPSPGKIRAIEEMAEPRSREELMRVLGVVGYYRGFVAKYANYVEPFRDILSTKNRFRWTAAHREAFQEIKKRFMDTVVLKYYIPEKKFKIQTDASKAGISAVLYQHDDEGNPRIISLISRTLSKHEVAYGATELELLAIIYAVMKLRTYLLGRKFDIITDHQALTFLMHTPFHNHRLIRWSLIIQEYDFDISHCKGKDNIVADYFSRYFPDVNDEVKNDQNTVALTEFVSSNGVKDDFECVELAAVNKIDMPELKYIRKLQDQDRDLANLKDEDKEYYCVNDGVLFHKNKNEIRYRVVIPVQLQKELIELTHERSGHMGSYKTLKALEKLYYWRGMSKDVKKLVSTCDLCQRVKSLTYSMEGAFMHVKSERPGEMVAIDFFGELPMSTGGVKYILVVLDVFSKLVKLYPIKKETTQSAINRMEQYIQDVGKPRRLLNDHGTQFTSAVWKSFLAEKGIEMVYCSIRHPQSDPAERTMREIGRLFRTVCSERHSAWARHVKNIEEWMNMSVSSATGYSPIELHFGKRVRDRLEEIVKFPEGVDESHEIMIEIANERMESGRKRSERSQKSISKISLKVGDKVLLRVPRLSCKANREIDKFFHIFYGPYVISRKYNENAFELSEVDNPTRVKGNYNKKSLKPYKTNV